MRLVFDTNILVSSLIRKDTPPYFLYHVWRNQRFDLLTSDHQLAEVSDVLVRPRMQKYVSADEAEEMIRGQGSHRFPWCGRRHSHHYRQASRQYP